MNSVLKLATIKLLYNIMALLNYMEAMQHATWNGLVAFIVYRKESSCGLGIFL